MKEQFQRRGGPAAGAPPLGVPLQYGELHAEGAPPRGIPCTVMAFMRQGVPS